jgi:hypothetical protein
MMHNELRRGQRPEHRDQIPARRRGHQPGHHGQVPAIHNEAEAWAQRSNTCDAQRGSGLGTAVKYLRRTASGAAGNGLSLYRGLLMCPFTTSAPHFFFCACLRRQQANYDCRGPGFRWPVCVCVWGPNFIAVFKLTIYKESKQVYCA